MPWHKVRNHSDCPPDRPWAVVLDADGSVAGCHPSEDAADEQLAALYANEPEMAATASGCSCESGPEQVVAGPLVVATLRQGDSVLGRVARVQTAPFDQPFPTPEYPPAEWFNGPPTWVAAWRAENGYPADDSADGVLKLTVTDEGRVGGWFFDKGACIIHDHAACPGPSPTGYAAFHQNEVVLDDGTVLRAGVIGNTHGHASPWVDWKQAQRHYADPDAQMIVCRAGDDERGAWIAGAIVPGLSYGDVQMLRRCALSGDWRPMPDSWWSGNGVDQAAVVAAEGYDCIGPTLVTRPALPLVTAYAASLGDRPVILGGSGGVDLDPEVEQRGHPEGPTIVEDADGTIRVEHQEGVMRRTIHHPDGTVEIVEETPTEAIARARAASIEESLVARLDLALAAPDRPFDVDGARARVVAWATDEHGVLDESRLASAYLWADRTSSDDGERTDYRFQIADVVDGDLVAIPAGIRAAAAALHDHSTADRPLAADARAAAIAALDVYYAAMASAFGDDAPVAPWVAAPDDVVVMEDEEPEADDSPVSRAEFAAVVERVAALEEFASALIEAQMASMTDAPLPSFADVAGSDVDDVPLPVAG